MIVCRFFFSNSPHCEPYDDILKTKRNSRNYKSGPLMSKWILFDSWEFRRSMKLSTHQKLFFDGLNLLFCFRITKIIEFFELFFIIFNWNIFQLMLWNINGRFYFSSHLNHYHVVSVAFRAILNIHTAHVKTKKWVYWKGDEEIKNEKNFINSYSYKIRARKATFHIHMSV